MGKKEPDWTDAEFEVVEPAPRKLRFPQDYVITFDWRVFLVIAATSIAGFIAALAKP